MFEIHHSWSRDSVEEIEVLEPDMQDDEAIRAGSYYIFETY